jgi:Ca2+-transporting ATPase
MSYRSNRMILFAFFFGILLQVAVTELSLFVRMFETVELSLAEWLRLLALSTVPLWLHEIRALYHSRMHAGEE